jgi:hypothetical protein
MDRISEEIQSETRDPMCTKQFGGDQIPLAVVGVGLEDRPGQQPHGHKRWQVTTHWWSSSKKMTTLGIVWRISVGSVGFCRLNGEGGSCRLKQSKRGFDHVFLCYVIWCDGLTCPLLIDGHKGLGYGRLGLCYVLIDRDGNFTYNMRTRYEYNT